MITPLLKTTLDPITRRRRLLWKLRWWTVVFLCLAALAAALRWMDIGVIPAQLIVLASLVMIWVGHRRAERWHPDYRVLARQIEERHPELHALLLTAVEQRPDAATGKLHFLQQRVLAEAVEMAGKEQWVDAVPRSRLAIYGALAVATYVLMMICAFSLGQRPHRHAEQLAFTKKEGVEVTPGDISLERGSGLVVLATFHHAVPSEATLVVQTANQATERIALLKNLDDPVFGGGLPEVDADLTYRVEYAGSSTRDYVVRVFEHPRLERADATVRFPDYTKLQEKQIPDTRRVSAVEGSTLNVVFKLNKPVKSAVLVAKDGKQIPLRAEAVTAMAELRDFRLQASQGYELRLTDTDGRTNKVPAQLTIEVLPNRRPELKFAAPRGDQRLSPIEEVAFRAEAWDDFGLARYGLTINVAARGEQQLVLGSGSTVDERREVSHLLKLEELGVKPDELISWFLWAEDVGPDGKPRRTASDMFFGEVRPFEEIYRPGDGEEGGESAGAGGGGRGGQATKLAELQKQIISATWNLKRAEESAEKSPTEKYLKDEPVVRDSQGDALKKATALAEKVEEPKSRALVENVTREMQSALDHLIAAEKAIPPLADALAAEQSAYNALLKLAAHEFRVTRRQRGQAGQGGQANQQQLDQLELKEERQRYETKREAEPMQNEQQREELAILNRLKELAQRQQDINERLKELQTALREAKTEKEKEEVRRELKRLRDEEQQLLADIDEARQKMEQSPRQSQLAEERRKLDETRADAQKAAEAMEQNAASPALASGTRAARKLQEMRDDLRKRTSRQFNDEMRQMRADARELAARQEKIGETLKDEPGKTSRPTLDGSSEREQVAKKLEEQQAALGQLTEEIKRVSEQAEAAEPLLSKELYDAFRKTTQAGTDKKLEITQQLAQRGYNSQAQKFEEKARQEIDELKTGVEHAAESVLGNEAEALRQARAELDTLTAQLNREIARARPDLANASGEEKNPGTDNVTRDPQKTPPADQAAQQQDRRAQDQQQPGDRVGQVGQTSQPNGQQTAQQAREGEGQRRASADARQNGEQRSENSQQGPGPQAGEGQQPNGQGQQQTAQAGSQPGGGAQGGSGQDGQRSPQSAESNQDAGSPQEGRGSRRGARGGESSSNQNPPGNQTGARLAELGDSSRDRGGIRSGGNEREGRWGGGGGAERAAPLTGEDFVGWSDRLRNVEEMIDDPAMRSEVARIRELAKGVRVEFKRHSVQPNWERVKTKIGAPLLQLRNQLTEELARRESKENLVPIDRDPVPIKYTERVRRYYEELGRSR